MGSSSGDGKKSGYTRYLGGGRREDVAILIGNGNRTGVDKY